MKRLAVADFQFCHNVALGIVQTATVTFTCLVLKVEQCIVCKQLEIIVMLYQDSLVNLQEVKTTLSYEFASAQYCKWQKPTSSNLNGIYKYWYHFAIDP
jgi:hypothetical protein